VVDDALTSLLDLHAKIEKDLNVKLESLAAQEIEAQRVISACFEQRQQVDRERAGLKEAARIYREAFGAGGNFRPEVRVSVTAHTTQPSASSSIKVGTIDVPLVDPELFPYRPVRARIGPQRFLIFNALHMMDKLDTEDITLLTKLNLRRVKDQIASDLKLGMISQVGSAFTLTSAGMDLLERYKTYKRTHGQPLPTADDHSQEEDRDEQETDNQIEGESEMHNARADPLS